MKHLFQKFIKEEKAVAAIEFAFIALPFIALIYGICQLALVFFANGVLDSGMKNATRLIFTGQAQEETWGGRTAADKLAKFREEVCHQASFMLDCDKIVFDIRTLSSFGESAPGITFTAEGNIDNRRFGLNLGAGNSIVLARAMYLFPVYADPLGAGLINTGSKQRLIVSSVVFVNEPF